LERLESAFPVRPEHFSGTIDELAMLPELATESRQLVSPPLPTKPASGSRARCSGLWLLATAIGFVCGSPAPAIVQSCGCRSGLHSGSHAITYYFINGCVASSHSRFQRKVISQTNMYMVVYISECEGSFHVNRPQIFCRPLQTDGRRSATEKWNRLSRTPLSKLEICELAGCQTVPPSNAGDKGASDGAAAGGATSKSATKEAISKVNIVVDTRPDVMLGFYEPIFFDNGCGGRSLFGCHHRPWFRLRKPASGHRA
jgi:hypothetical protein